MKIDFRGKPRPNKFSEFVRGWKNDEDFKKYRKVRSPPQWDTYHGNVGSGAEKSYLNTHSFNHMMGPFLGHPKKEGGGKNV
jgi:hypothetical protein